MCEPFNVLYEFLFYCIHFYFLLEWSLVKVSQTQVVHSMGIGLHCSNLPLWAQSAKNFCGPRLQFYIINFEIFLIMSYNIVHFSTIEIASKKP